ncbi:MAG: NAD-dependent epimerase/dehydratase family protein [Burkholderiaceae bacterium]
MEKILVIGANGQIGSELTAALAQRHGAANVLAADIGGHSRYGAARYQRLDVLDRARLTQLVADNGITQVYQLAAMLSATGEQAPLAAWNLNMNGLLNVLEVARERTETGAPLSVFWPSSIAVFGPHTPADGTPQDTVMDPSSMYGISKLAGERLCEYYFQHYGVDVRSIRYPGVISYKSPPGGGTTDYAIAMLYAAAAGENYTSFLGPDSSLPMIYMPDALRATLELMAAPAARIRVRSSYNVAGVSFSPSELARQIAVRRPGFRVHYQPDERQAIADSWPHSIDDSAARSDWGWHAEIGLERMVDDMLANIPAHQPSHKPAGVPRIA